MSHGPFVDDIVLNDTVLPNAADTIKIANTILVDSRIRRCLIELDSMVDDGQDTSFASLLTTLNSATTNITTLQLGKADADLFNNLATQFLGISVLYTAHDQDTNYKRHINVGAGTTDYYLAYDTSAPDGSNNAWKPLPGAAPMVFELKTSSFTAEANHFYQTDVSAPLTITLPATPVQGDLPIKFRIEGASATNIITFARNGENIERIADDGFITGNGTITVMFAGTIGGVNVGWTLDDGQTH